jgi:hypothetical protein
MKNAAAILELLEAVLPSIVKFIEATHGPGGGPTKFQAVTAIATTAAAMATQEGTFPAALRPRIETAAQRAVGDLKAAGEI